MPYLVSDSVPGASKPGIWFNGIDRPLQRASRSLDGPLLTKGEVLRLLGITAVVAIAGAILGGTKVMIAGLFVPFAFGLSALYEAYTDRRAAPKQFTEALNKGEAIAVKSYVHYEIDGQLKEAGCENGLRQAEEDYPLVAGVILLHYLNLCRPHTAVLNDTSAETAAQRDAMACIKAYAEQAAQLIAAIVTFANSGEADEQDPPQP
jgi:hypothetical protein